MLTVVTCFLKSLETALDTRWQAVQSVMATADVSAEAKEKLEQKVNEVRKMAADHRTALEKSLELVRMFWT